MPRPTHSMGGGAALPYATAHTAWEGCSPMPHPPLSYAPPHTLDEGLLYNASRQTQVQGAALQCLTPHTVWGAALQFLTPYTRWLGCCSPMPCPTHCLRGLLSYASPHRLYEGAALISPLMITSVLPYLLSKTLHMHGRSLEPIALYTVMFKGAGSSHQMLNRHWETLQHSWMIWFTDLKIYIYVKILLFYVYCSLYANFNIVVKALMFHSSYEKTFILYFVYWSGWIISHFSNI